MTKVFAGRSPMQIAEDNLLDMATVHYDLSDEDSRRYRLRRRVINPLSMVRAQELLERWQGTDEDLRECHRISMLAAGEALKAGCRVRFY